MRKILVVSFMAFMALCLMAPNSGYAEKGALKATGYFTDGPVQGLRYKTPTQSGATDSKGKFSRESLEKMALPDLYIVKDALDKAQPKTFVSVMRDAQEGKTKPKSPGTVGSYNQDTKTYEGGL